MNNKNIKGFTLIELLTVISLLAIIALIAIPSISKMTKSSTEKAYNTQINNIKVAAKEWAAENVNMLPSKGETMTLTLGELKTGGQISSDITNPKTREKFNDNCTVVNITNSVSGLTYEVDLEAC